ncbi:MAG: hypothetical protein ACJ8F2_01250 [Xanthobacteraceae bacterium]
MTVENLTRQQRRHLARVKAKAFDRQPYIAAIAGATPAGFPAGRVTIAHIAHEPHCPLLNGGLCRCAPEITFETWPTRAEEAS